MIIEILYGNDAIDESQVSILFIVKVLYFKRNIAKHTAIHKKNDGTRNIAIYFTSY